MRLLVPLLLLLTGYASVLHSCSLSELTVLRGSLPAPDLALLDGQGQNTCPEPSRRLERLLYRRTLHEGAALSCGNRVLGLVHFPQADPSYSDQRADPLGGFAQLRDEILEARREILLQNMFWEDGEGSPGEALAQALAQLRLQVRDHPERYPDGLHVRIMLGHSIHEQHPFDPAFSAYNAAADLLRAGIPLDHDDVPGWRLELADYRWAFPHQHVKLLVIDGERLSAGGYNISGYHLPSPPRGDPPAHGGRDLNDLALTVSGPLARHGVAAFRDSWLSSRRLRCAQTPTSQTLTPRILRQRCAFREKTSFPLYWAAPAPARGEANVYSLYRRAGYTASDDTLAELFAASRQSVDLMQSQVSGTLACSLSLNSGRCRYPQDQLPVWRALLIAIRDHGVRVRLILDEDPISRIESLSMLNRLREELKVAGAAERLQVRWYGAPGGTHTKAALIDGELLTVGSHNLHHSSFGPRGLGEYTLATSDSATLRAFQRQFAFEWRRARDLW